MEALLDPRLAPEEMEQNALRPREDEPPWVLVADDDADVRAVLAHVLRDDGFRVAAVSDGRALLELLEGSAKERRLPDLVILDHRMPGRTGLDVLEKVTTSGWRVGTVLMTAFGPEVVDAARALGASAVFEKPFDLEDLLAVVYSQVGIEPPPPRIPDDATGQD